MPLSNDEVRAGIAGSAVNALVDIKWSWSNAPSKVYDWHASLVEKCPDGNARVFFARGQRGMPALEVNQTGLTAELPHAGVIYHSITYEQAVNTNMFTVENAMNANKAPAVAFALHDPTTWACQIEESNVGAELVKTRIALELGLTPECSLLRRRSIEAVLKFVDACQEVEEWWQLPQYVGLGAQLVRTARETVAYETLKITSADIAKKTAKVDHGTDEVGAALAELRSDKRGAAEKRQQRYCTFCKKKGHTLQYCRAAAAGSNPKNETGGAPPTVAKRN